VADVTIYTTRFCPFCVAAKRLLESLGVEPIERALESDDELRQRLSKENGGWSTVPMIFIGDRFVGGFEDLQQLHREGRLEPMLT